MGDYRPRCRLFRPGRAEAGDRSAPDLRHVTAETLNSSPREPFSLCLEAWEDSMPTLDRLQSFIARVEQQDYVGAIMHFYHEDASMQENTAEPRRGRDALVAHEMEILLRFGGMPVRKVERFAINGDHVFINWIFEIRQKDGSFRLLDEVAMQEWSGDRILKEQFYYDPAQIR